MLGGRMGGWEWVILFAIVLLLFGARRLPDLARSVGRSMKIFKSEVKDLRTDDEPAAGSASSGTGSSGTASSSTAATATGVPPTVGTVPPVAPPGSPVPPATPGTSAANRTHDDSEPLGS